MLSFSNVVLSDATKGSNQDPDFGGEVRVTSCRMADLLVFLPTFPAQP